METLLLVVSDLHLGKGRFLENGQENILEDFREDDRFLEFLEYYSTGDFAERPIQLILNGDIFNLIQIDIDGLITSQITEERTVKALEKIIKGHEKFFTGLKNFLTAPQKKIVYIIGNHDAGMEWKGPQKKLQERVQGPIEFTQQFTSFGVHIEHGHRFESINSVPAHKVFIKNPMGQQILNLPWGSLFCIEILPTLKKERPFIDRVRPMSAYIKWCLIHDLFFFIKINFVILKFIWSMATNDDLGKKWSLKGTFSMLRQLTLYPRYEKQAKAILKQNPAIHTVIMGHTHLTEWRKFPEGKFYFNTGTWNHIPSMDSGLHTDDSNLTYVLAKVDPDKSTFFGATMNIWQGKWRPYREEISLESIALNP